MSFLIDLNDADELVLAFDFLLQDVDEQRAQRDRQRRHQDDQQGQAAPATQNPGFLLSVMGHSLWFAHTAGGLPRRAGSP